MKFPPACLGFCHRQRTLKQRRVTCMTLAACVFSCRKRASFFLFVCFLFAAFAIRNLESPQPCFYARARSDACCEVVPLEGPPSFEQGERHGFSLGLEMKDSVVCCGEIVFRGIRRTPGVLTHQVSERLPTISVSVSISVTEVATKGG